MPLEVVTIKEESSQDTFDSEYSDQSFPENPKELEKLEKFMETILVEEVKKHSTESQKDCKYVENLNSVLQNTIPEVSQDRECPFCKEKFRGPIEYSNHVRKHKKDEDEYRCEICNAKFAWRQSLKLHIYTHNTHKSFVCKFPGCTFATHTARNLKGHYYTRHFIKSKKGSVNKLAEIGGEESNEEISDTPQIISNLEFSSIISPGTSSQNVHLESFEPKTHDCNFCNQKFQSRMELNNHVRKHKKEEEYRCEICDQKFAWKQSLKTHKLTHNTELNFICHFCTYATHTLRNLQAHLNSQHHKKK